MANLKEYLENAKKQESNSLLAPSSKGLASAIFKEINTSPLVRLSNNEAEEFSHKISELATSDDVINELSDELGAPKNHETEDEFVERAKSALTKILKNKLSK